MLHNWSLKLIIRLLKFHSLVCFLANLKIVTNIEKTGRGMEPVGVMVCREIKQVIYKFLAGLISLQWLANSLNLGISKGRSEPEGGPRSLD